eukprot:4758826-Prorocentrum_lima.AAC.1
MANQEWHNNFFRELEKLPFPEETFNTLVPDQVKRWKLLGAAKSVPWTWVMVCELALASFLSPSAMLVPAAGIRIFALVWLFFIHPGSTNTSGVLGQYGDILDEIELQ